MANVNPAPFTATCARTGETDKLQMYALRNEAGSMIGWIFLSEETTSNFEAEIEIKFNAIASKSKTEKKEQRA